MISFPFLGGPLSGVLVGVSLLSIHDRVLAWFSLVPLLFALERHRERPRLRVVHGLSFGVILAFLTLPWLPRVLGAYVGDPAVAGSPARFWTLSWGLLTAWSTAFALVCGWLLHRLHPVGILFAVPALWTGLEGLRTSIQGAWIPSAAWLPLGCAVPLDAPEAQAAAVVGLPGLGFLLVACSTAFLLVLRTPAFWRQVRWTAVGISFPLLTVALGTWDLPEDPAAEDVSVLVTAHRVESLDDLLDLSWQRGARDADILVWPELPASVSPDDPRVPATLAEYRSRVGGAVLASFRSGQPDGSGASIPAVWLDASGEEAFLPGSDAPGGCLGIVTLGAERIGVARAEAFLDPACARALARRGATFFVSLSWSPTGTRPGFATFQRLAAFRSIESRRWLVHADPDGSFLSDPTGAVVLRLQGEVDGTGLETLQPRRGVTPHDRYGWALVLVCIAATCATVLWVAVARARDARRAGWLL